MSLEPRRRDRVGRVATAPAQGGYGLVDLDGAASDAAAFGLAHEGRDLGAGRMPLEEKDEYGRDCVQVDRRGEEKREPRAQVLMSARCRRLSQRSSDARYGRHAVVRAGADV